MCSFPGTFGGVYPTVNQRATVREYLDGHPDHRRPGYRIRWMGGNGYIRWTFHRPAQIDAFIPTAIRYMSRFDFPRTERECLDTILRVMARRDCTTTSVALWERGARLWRDLTGEDEWFCGYDEDSTVMVVRYGRINGRDVPIAERIPPKTTVAPFYCWVCGEIAGFQSKARSFPAPWVHSLDTVKANRIGRIRLSARMKRCDTTRIFRSYQNARYSVVNKVADIISRTAHTRDVYDLVRLQLSISEAQLGIRDHVERQRKEKRRIASEQSGKVIAHHDFFGTTYGAHVEGAP